MKIKHLIVFGLLSLFVYACSGSGGSSDNKIAGNNKSSQFVSDPGTVLSTEPVSVAGIVFNPPTSWTDLGPSGMRQADYAFGPVEGESDSATMTVYYFGQNQGGAAQANIDRWVAQMQQPDNSDSKAKALQQQLTINDMTVHVVELSGSYSAGGMGMGQSIVKENYWMCAAVLEGPQGSLFFKLTGPDKTAKEMTKSFATMINAIQKDAGE